MNCSASHSLLIPVIILLTSLFSAREDNSALAEPHVRSCAVVVRCRRCAFYRSSLEKSTLQCIIKPCGCATAAHDDHTYYRIPELGGGSVGPAAVRGSQARASGTGLYGLESGAVCVQRHHHLWCCPSHCGDRLLAAGHSLHCSDHSHNGEPAHLSSSHTGLNILC